MNIDKLKSLVKGQTRVIVLAFIAGLFLGGVFFNSSNEKQGSHEDHEQAAEKVTIWTCSMHPQIRQNKPGLCPICAMELVPLTDSGHEGDSLDPNEIQMTDAAMKLADVQTTIVKRGVPEKTVHLSGKVKPDERNIAELTARFGGRIEKLFVNYTGQNVKKGQKLATIYSPDLVTTQRELLEAMKYKETNPAFYKAARGKLRLWDLTDKQVDAIEKKAEPTLYFEILTPISGTVTKRHIAIGDYVKEGSALFEVIDLTSIWIMFDAYERDLPWIQVHDKVEFTLQSLPGKMYTASVSYIDPFIDAKTRVAHVRVELPNPDLALKPEMFVSGILESAVAENSDELLIPKSAILWTGKRAIVYVKVPQREKASFIYREITLGPEAGNFYVVRDGLQQGEEIAINGVFKIDASAQLAGKTSMMNPKGINQKGSVAVYQHTDMNMDMPMTKTKEPPGQSKYLPHAATVQHETFRVGGDCEMCKERIEKAAMGLPGVNNADWNIETKMFHVSFNTEKIELRDIHKAIAQAGHDTELETAPDSVYDNLPVCCQYTREN